MNISPSLQCGAMDTRIFNLGLSVLATSAYIIVAALQPADGPPPARAAIESRWNARPEELDEALTELESLRIIARRTEPGQPEPGYLVNPASQWQTRA